MKFANTTARDQAVYFQPWEYGIAAMLTTDLEKTAMFNIVDREQLNDIIKEQRFQLSGLVDPKTTVKIGKFIAAKYILSGTYMISGAALKITAQVFSVQEGIQLGAVSVSGKKDDFFLVEKDLFENVAKTLRVVLNEEEKAKIMMAVETKSVDASLKNYAGEIALLKADEMEKRGNEKEKARLRNAARKDFKAALEHDPQYERAKKNLAKLVMAIPMTL